MATKRNRGYSEKKSRSNRMYAPCGTGKTVWDQDVADVKYWVSKIRYERGPEYSMSAVTLEDIKERKEQDKKAA